MAAAGEARARGRMGRDGRQSTGAGELRTGVNGGGVPESPPLCNVNGGRLVRRARTGVGHDARASGAGRRGAARTGAARRPWRGGRGRRAARAGACGGKPGARGRKRGGGERRGARAGAPSSCCAREGERGRAGRAAHGSREGGGRVRGVGGERERERKRKWEKEKEKKEKKGGERNKERKRERGAGFAPTRCAPGRPRATVARKQAGFAAWSTAGRPRARRAERRMGQRVFGKEK